MKKSVKVLLIVLCVVCVGVFCFSGYKLFSTLNEYKIAQRSYDKLSEQYVSTEPPAATESPVSETGDSDEDKEVSPITVDFQQLLSTNDDVCGWLYSKDTVINYPVAQGEDNNQYLHHLLDGTYNSSGTLFLDCECGPEFSGANSIIYGHNMKDGSMFNSLHSYSDQAYYDAHPVLYGAWLNKMKSQSVFTTDTDVTVDDRVVTLSTCTYEYDNARFVVQGKLVPLDG